MTFIYEHDWPAERPSAEFAERTVSGILAPVRLATVPVRSRPGRRLYWFVAAILVSGSALGLTWSRYNPPRSAAHIGVVQQLPMPGSMRRSSSSLLSVKAPSVVRLIAKPKGTAERPAKIQQKSANRLPQPKAPACQCERGFADFICDCY